MNKTDQTAILVFSRSAVNEAKAKKYSGYLGSAKGFSLASQLINYTISEAKKSNLPVFTHFSGDQLGKNFSERLSNSIESIFSKGFANIIVVGGDSPSITTSLLQRIDKKFTEHDLIIGPAKDGGVYFIGLSKEGYRKSEFLNMPWLSNRVSEAFKSYASIANISFTALEQGEDVDDIESFEQWLNKSQFHKLHSSLTKILQLTKRVQRLAINLKSIQDPYFFLYKLRGPPIFSKSL